MLSSVKTSGSFVGKQHYFAFSQGTYRYLGTRSPLLQVETQDWRVGELQNKRASSFPSHAVRSHGDVTPDLQRYLLGHFVDSIHQIYPILDTSQPWLSPDLVVNFDSSPIEAFVLQMVYGIACHCDEAHSSVLLPLATAAHSRALQYFEKATDESSISTLQVAILLVIYTLFDPSSGNLSQQVGFAVRLAIDLAGSDAYEQSPTLSTLHKIIYCLENQACSVLVRPTSLQEPTTALTFSTEDPLEFLCTLYRIQARVRSGTVGGTICDALSTITDNAIQELHPNILSTLWETRLMLDASAPTATRLINTYSDDRYIATFLTTHWVHEAGRIIIDAVATAEGSLRADLMLAYGSAVALLSKWSARWSAASTLLKCLQSRLSAQTHPNIVDIIDPT